MACIFTTWFWVSSLYYSDGFIPICHTICVLTQTTVPLKVYSSCGFSNNFLISQGRGLRGSLFFPFFVDTGILQPPPPICSPASVEQNSTSSGKPWWATATSTETGRSRKTSWLSAWASNSAEMTSLHPAQSCFPPSVWPPYVSIPGDDALWFTPPSSSLHRELEFSLHVLSKESQNPPLDICVWFAS